MTLRKYPRTFHLPWSPGLQNDDKRIETIDGFYNIDRSKKCFCGQADGAILFDACYHCESGWIYERTPRDLVVSIKMDGENTSMYREHIHARSIDSKHHPSRSWVKAEWSKIRHLIPESWQVCGENLYAKHSIHYTGDLALPSYFMVFGVYDHADAVWLSWSEVEYVASEIGFPTVPRIYPGTSLQRLRKAQFELDYPGHEGYVVRVTDEIPDYLFNRQVAKYVRAHHVQTSEHWMNQQVVPNESR